MRSKNNPDRKSMVSELFFRLLPVQVAIVAMGSINSIVDGIVASRFIDPSVVGVVGLYYTMIRILEASGAVLLGGASVLCGRHIGAGRLDKTRGVCSLVFYCALIIGILLTAASLFAPRAVAVALGADAGLEDALTTYVTGYGLGIIPQLLAQQLAVSLQLERQGKRGQAGIIVMIAVNVILDILFVHIMDMGVWGLALATSVANWAYFCVLGQYYLLRKAQLRPSLKLISWNELPTTLKIGFPNALLVGCLAIRSLVINRILLTYSGEEGLGALSAFNMVSGLIIALALGTGAVIRMLSSVYYGESNREDAIALIKLSCTKVMAIILALTVVSAALSPLMSRIFFPDTASNLYQMTKQLFLIYSFCIPLTMACIIFASYYQATGHRIFVNLISVLDGFASMVIPSLILAPMLGAFGVWLSFPIGLLITLSASVLYPIIRLRRLPHSIDDWMLLPSDFGTENHLVLELHNMDDVMQTAIQIQSFCDENNVVQKTGAFAALCLEEMAGNIVHHGFTKDRKAHLIEVRVLLKANEVMLRIKDDCIPFNPKERYEMTSHEDPSVNIGIRVVYGLAKLVEYQNLLGLNVLTIHLDNTSTKPSSC